MANIDKINVNGTTYNLVDSTSGYITVETDPTVPSWAKQSSKPTYTASEVGALPSTTSIPSKTSDLTNDSNFVSSSDLAEVATTGDYDDLSNKPSIPTETTVSGWGFTKNTGTVTGVKMNGSTLSPTSGVVNLGTVLTSFTESDPTVPSWAKQSSKPAYTASEVGALPDTTVIPSKVSDLTNDEGYLTSSDVSRVALVGEYDALIGKPDLTVYKCVVVTSSSFSSLPQTLSNANLTASHVVINSVLSNPSAQTGDWTVTTSSGSLSISGSISGSTTITLYLIEQR